MGTFSLEGSRERWDRGNSFQFIFPYFWRPDPLAYILRVASSEFLSFSILILIFLHFHGDIFFGRVKREERDRGNSFNRHYWIPLFVTNLKNSNEYLIVRNITKFNYPYLSTATINVFWEYWPRSMLKAKALLHVHAQAQCKEDFKTEFDKLVSWKW